MYALALVIAVPCVICYYFIKWLGIKLGIREDPDVIYIVRFYDKRGIMDRESHFNYYQHAQERFDLDCKNANKEWYSRIELIKCNRRKMKFTTCETKILN